MIRKNEVSIGELIRDFFEENPELYQGILEARVIQGWKDMLGPQIESYTTNIFIKNRTLYVSLSSSVVRSELMMCRDRLVEALNKEAKDSVIDTLIIR